MQEISEHFWTPITILFCNLHKINLLFETYTLKTPKMCYKQIALTKIFRHNVKKEQFVYDLMS